jgi:hypothetical protein
LFLSSETRPSSIKKAEWQKKSAAEKFREFLLEKYMVFSVSFWNSYYAIGHLAFGLEYPWENEDAEMESNPTPEDIEPDNQGSSNNDGTASEDDTVPERNSYGTEPTNDDSNVPQNSESGEQEILSSAKKEL